MPVDAVWPNKMMSVKWDPKCGPINASLNSSKSAGPNGSQAWLTCGLNTTTGWKPPSFTIHDVIVKDLEAAVKMPNSPYTRCQQWFPYFYKYGEMFDVPPIIIAAFANQESGCNAETIGGGDEQGLMQITPDKCGGAPGGNCRDPDFNIRTAVAYFAGVLKENKGKLIHTIGGYNGWFVGMTVQAATAAATTPCCRCQQNLDYIHQMLNGWILGIDAYVADLATYNNLNVCNQPPPASSAPAPSPSPAPTP